MAPEAIGELNYSPESDVWSLGITIWELVTRQDPSKQMGLVDLAVAIRDTGYHPKIPAWAPDWLREIFDGCWRKKPEERMTLDDILSVLGLSADEIATVQLKRKSTSVTSGYAQIDSTSPKSSKKNRKAKQKSKEAPKKDEGATIEISLLLLSLTA
jgi:serine/threonine protein kinase